MKIATLCFLTDGPNILLARKKNKIGAGKWNGYGGVVKDGENIRETAVRELKEESGVETRPRSLEKVALITFYVNDKGAKWQVHVFLAKRWKGEPKETEKMGRPEWFSVLEIPYGQMMPGDIRWLSMVAFGARIKSKVYYNSDLTEVVNFTCEEVLFVKRA